MEVHPPEHAIHNWRDFFVHIGTITIGLLIAIGLEQTVELLHHRHQRHTAERNLEREFRENRNILQENERQLAISQKQIAALTQALSAPRISAQQDEAAWPKWNWSNLVSTAWDTARTSNVTALMPFDQVQHIDGVYTQQSIVNAQSALYIKDIYDVDTPLLEHRDLSQLPPDTVRSVQASLERTTTDLMYLLDLCHSLESVYKSDPLAESAP